MTAGDIYTVAGNGTGGYSGDGGPATSAELAGPAGVAVDGSGNLVIADAFNNRIRAVTFTVVTPSITTSQQPATATAGSSIADQATVTGGDNPTGTVTFNLYNNPNGTGTPLFTDTENLVGGVATSAGYTTTATGTDYWVATYNGDSNNSTVTSGTAAEPVTVTPAAATHLTVSAPASVTAGSPFSVTVSAEDQFNNLATTYRGTVHFTTTDAGAGVVLPADYTFTSGDNGTHTFTNLVSLVTAGPQTVTVTDTTHQLGHRHLGDDHRHSRASHPPDGERARQRHRRLAVQRHGQRRGPIQQPRHHVSRHGTLHHHRRRRGRGAAGGLHLHLRR